MPERERALRPIGLEFLPEPLNLRRASYHRDLAVEGDHAPGPFAERIVALTGIPRQRTEILEVAGRARRFVLVVARDRAGAIEMPAPHGIVAIAKIRGTPVHVGKVAQRQYPPRQAIEQLCGVGGPKAALAD